MPSDEDLFAKAVKAAIPAVEAEWYPTTTVRKPLPFPDWRKFIDPEMVKFAGRKSKTSELTKYVQRGSRQLVPREHDEELCAPDVDSLESFRAYMTELVENSILLEEKNSTQAIVLQERQIEGSIGDFWNEDDSEVDSKAEVTSKPADDQDTAHSQALQKEENVSRDAQTDITAADTAMGGGPGNDSAGPATPPGANANRAAATRLRVVLRAARAAPVQAQTAMPQAEEPAVVSATAAQELALVIDRLHKAKMRAAPASDPAGDRCNPGWVKHQAGKAGHAALMAKILAKETEVRAELASGNLTCAQQASRQLDLQLCTDLQCSDWFRGTSRNVFA